VPAKLVQINTGYCHGNQRKFAYNTATDFLLKIPLLLLPQLEALLEMFENSIDPTVSVSVFKSSCRENVISVVFIRAEIAFQIVPEIAYDFDQLVGYYLRSNLFPCAGQFNWNPLILCFAQRTRPWLFFQFITKEFNIKRKISF